MKRTLRRFGYLLFIIIWLMIMCFPTFAFTLAMREQIQLGSNPRNHIRFFTIQENSEEGVGVEWARPVLGKSCAKTTVAYLFWEGGSSNENVTFCQCYDPQTNAPLPVAENICK